MKQKLMALLLAVCCVGSMGMVACNAQKNDEFGYALSEDGSYLIVSGVMSEIEGEVEIPEMAQHGDEYLPVEEIAENAFYNFDGLTGITIPANIKRIGEDAFFSCDNLKNVNFEDENGWYRQKEPIPATEISATDLEDASIAAEYLTITYCEFVWTKGVV